MRSSLNMRVASVAALLAFSTSSLAHAQAPAPTAPRVVPTAPATGPGPELSGDENGALGFNNCRKQPRGSKFRITLPEESELKDLVNWMMSVSCQKFIWDPKIRSGKVTILSPEAVTIEEAYAAFYAALQTMGLTVEPSGEYFKIVESIDAKSRNLPIYGPGGRAPTNDRFVTQLYRTKGSNTAEIVDLLNKLKSKQGSVDTVGDLILITDTGSSVRRLLQIVRQVDDPETTGKQEKIFFFQLHYANPEETAETIREIFGEKEQQGAARGRGRGARNAAPAPATDSLEPSFSRVVVDERTGTLIIVAPIEDYEVIRRLIERLDVPLAGGGGRIHVVRLVNADPEEVAQVLTQLGSGAKAGGAGRRGAQGAQGQPQAQPANPEAAELFSGDIKVTADPATRSLVILSSTSDFEALREVIEQLDAPRKQVYIECYLLELTIGRVFNVGVDAHFGRAIDTSGGQGLGFAASAQSAGYNSVTIGPELLQGLAAGVIGPLIPGSGALLGSGSPDIPAFGVVIQALQTNSDVNFVAEPHLYTADNKEASIEVGRNVPTQGGVTFPGGGGQGGLVPLQSIQRQDVALTVKVTPHVNDATQVTLDIELQNDDIESIDPTLGVTTTKRRLALESVVARDDQPVVLGGLIQEVERESKRQVPGLGSIPLLGWLFKTTRRERQKVNLMMILIPHIIETPDDVRRIHERRMKERLEFIERYTAFKRRDLDLSVNYRKKSGLLAEINREAGRMLMEDEFRRRADLELQQQIITGELGMSPSFHVEEEQAEAGAQVPGQAPAGAAGRTPPAAAGQPQARPAVPPTRPPAAAAPPPEREP